MKKTLSQRFFLPQLLIIIGCLWTSGVWAQTPAYTLDFTTQTTKNTDYTKDWTYSSNGISWTIKGAANYDGAWAYVRTGGKTQKYSYYKSQGIISGSISSIILTALNTQNNSSFTMSSIKLTVARDDAFTDVIDEVTLTDISTSMTFTPSAGKLWKDAYYQFYFTWNNTATKKNYGMDIEKLDFYASTSTEPYLEVNKSSLSFPETEIGNTSTQTFTLSGNSLTANAKLAITGTGAGMFSVSPSSVSPTDGTISDKEVTVTYAPTAAGSHEAILTVSSTGATDKVIALSGTAIAPLTHYTVNWMVNGNPYSEGTPSTDVAEGESIETLPTTPAAIGDKVFMGWTNATIVGTQDDAPAVLFTSVAEAPEVTANTTYFAVFADETLVSSSWNRIKNLADITNGSYVIKNDAYVLPSTTTGSSTAPAKVDAPEITDDVITGTVEESMIWNFTSTGTANQFYVQNEEGSYLYATNSNNGVRVGTTSDKWTFAVNTTDYFSMKATNNRYCASWGSGSDWRSYTDANHDNYANGGKLELYKLVTAYTYSAYATNFATLSNRNLAFSEPAVDYFEAPFTAPILNGHTEGVTYASSDTEVATVNETTGEITIGTKFGTTTITASAEQSGSYYADETSYTISVWPTSISGLKTLITSESEIDFKVKLNNAVITYADANNAYLQDADAAILIFIKEGHTMAVGQSYTGVASGKAKLFKGLREITSIDWGTIIPEVVAVPAAQVVTLAELNANYDQYESMYVLVQNAIVSSALSSRNATISQDSQEYAVYDKNNGLSATALSTTNAIAKIFAFPSVYNTSHQLNVFNAIDVEETGYNLAVSAAGYATYFNSAKAFTMPIGATGYVWDEGNIVAVYNSAQVVPANEPLVVEAAAGNYPLWFTTSTAETWKSAGMNALEGTDVATDIPEDNNYYFYGLSLNASSDPASVGFYWMNPTGAAFTNGAHKAYLKLAKSTPAGSQAVNGFPFNGTTTGIEQIEAGTDAKNAIYDLSGRRVNKAAKGIYILNGKKVLVK